MRQKESIDIQTNLPKYLVVSIDMQKILQFPILSTKDNHFNDKINLFNETIWRKWTLFVISLMIVKLIRHQVKYVIFIGNFLNRICAKMQMK